jgi:hypothetical protein
MRDFAADPVDIGDQIRDLIAGGGQLGPEV